MSYYSIISGYVTVCEEHGEWSEPAIFTGVGLNNSKNYMADAKLEVPIYGKDRHQEIGVCNRGTTVTLYYDKVNNGCSCGHHHDNNHDCKCILPATISILISNNENPNTTLVQFDIVDNKVKAHWKKRYFTDVNTNSFMILGSTPSSVVEFDIANETFGFVIVSDDSAETVKFILTDYDMIDNVTSDLLSYIKDGVDNCDISKFSKRFSGQVAIVKQEAIYKQYDTEYITEV